MTKKVLTRKVYVNEIKSRLYDTEAEKEEGYYLNERRLSETEINRMKQIVKEIAASENFVENPLGMLADLDVLLNVEENKKEKFILNLSDIYLKLRAKYGT